jgi:hypothetical protein
VLAGNGVAVALAPQAERIVAAITRKAAIMYNFLDIYSSPF